MATHKRSKVTFYYFELHGVTRLIDRVDQRCKRFACDLSRGPIPRMQYDIRWVNVILADTYLCGNTFTVAPLSIWNFTDLSFIHISASVGPLVYLPLSKAMMDSSSVRLVSLTGF